MGEKELEELIGLTQRVHVKNRGSEYTLDQSLRAEAARQEERERTAGQARLRKSKLLGLSFPYDWSNPNISDQALILNVLERGIFGVSAKACWKADKWSFLFSTTKIAKECC